jgi:glycerol-1-phosphate dehydrogenase [NAD(P)+]
MKPKYQDDKLIIPEPDCGCEYHVIPDTSIYIGSGIIEHAHEYIRASVKGEKCLLVTDSNLYDLFGDLIKKHLESEFDLRVCIPPSEDKLEPDICALGYIMMELEKDTDFMIAFGSGTVNDLVRYAASSTGRPFVSIGTAASMDGYLSVISPMLKGNLKINNPANYPVAGIYDLDIMATAPREMVFAGFGDVMGKYVAKADWLLSSYVTGEHVCPYCIRLVDSALSLCEENFDDIAKGGVKGVKALLEALLLAGLAMLLNTNSRPAASNEHNMGHYWEMMKLSAGLPHASHGEAVGVATLYCLDFYEQMLHVNEYPADGEVKPSDAFDPVKREKNLLEKYGAVVGRSIIDDNPHEPISREERLRRVENFKSNLSDIRKALSFLPSSENMRNLYRKLGGPLSAADISIGDNLLRDALLYAKDYRERYNIFKAAEELGVLEDTVDRIRG